MSYGGPVLLDASAWARVLLGLPSGEQQRFASAVAADEVWICEPFRLEALYSAQSDADYRRLQERLDVLPAAHGGPEMLRLALAAQAELAAARPVSHRVKPLDLQIAAIAHEHAAGVLHYDHDYNVIAGHTSLRMRSVWVAPRGSVA